MKMFWFGKKKQKSELIVHKYREERDARLKQENKEYDDICAKVKQVLSNAKKPVECNIVEFADAPFIFPFLKSYQYFTEWEIWRTDDVLYIYKSEVENYPDNYDAPCIAAIRVEDIQYFRCEGDVYIESKTSGGRITQNKHTGKISQTPIITKTINHDTRVVKLTVQRNGIIKHLLFKNDAYDVLFSLMPEKDYASR